MDLILEQGGRIFGYDHITEPVGFARPFGSQPYVCLVWDADGALGAVERQRLADAVINSNCRYVVCGGMHCEAWHDAMDEAFLALDLEGEDYEERFVMTSWHADEPEGEVASFFVHSTASDDEPFTKYLVLQVGGGWEAMQRLKAAVREEASDEADASSTEEDV